jgi:AAA15 family ATPase/GTPase
LEITDVELGEKDGKIVTYHSQYDENKLLVGSIPFPLDLMESEGTKKLSYFLGPIYDTLKNGKILFVDEFDTKLHPNLSKRLMELFHRHNTRGAQLIFTAQDVSLLDKDLLRRDQIWFASKNQFGESELYSLSEFNSETVRNTSDYQKKYLAHDFGAAEAMELKEEAMLLLYGA